MCGCCVVGIKPVERIEAKIHRRKHVFKISRPTGAIACLPAFEPQLFSYCKRIFYPSLYPIPEFSQLIHPKVQNCLLRLTMKFKFSAAKWRIFLKNFWYTFSLFYIINRVKLVENISFCLSYAFVGKL